VSPHVCPCNREGAWNPHKHWLFVHPCNRVTAGVKSLFCPFTAVTGVRIPLGTPPSGILQVPLGRKGFLVFVGNPIRRLRPARPQGGTDWPEKAPPENRERHCKAVGYTRGKMRGLHKPTRTHGSPRRRIKNPVPVTAEHLHPFPQMRPIAAVPGVGAVLKRARTPYKKSPLSEDEALNLVCDARSLEPTHPIEKLFKKFSHELER